MEIEAKIALSPEMAAQLREKLGSPMATVRQRDIYMQTAGLPVALRVREDAEQAWVTLKSGFRHVEGIRVREEWEPSIRPQDVPQWLTIFDQLGFPKGAEVAKTRQEYRRGEVQVVVDDVDGLGTFVELEVVGDDASSALIRLEAVIAELGLAHLPRITQSYRDLLAKPRV